MNTTDDCIVIENKNIVQKGADLRKLKMPELETILCSYGMTQPEIDCMERWARVGAVRNFSTRALLNGTAGALGKYARASALPHA